MSSAPARLLFVRPDTYGDLVLFEPVLRLVREAWPQTTIGMLVREPYADLEPLLSHTGVEWLTTGCNPYAEGPGDNRAAVDALRGTVVAFDPEWLVAPSFEKTWLEAVVASCVPRARQTALGANGFGELTRASLEAALEIDCNDLYPDQVGVEPELPEWEKNLRLVSALLGRESARSRPRLSVPTAAAERAADILAAAGLQPETFIACCPAGTANVKIKSWPAEEYGAVLGWLEREHGIRALVLGHESEHETLAATREKARASGANPAVWVGASGEMPLVAALLRAAQLYFGNDTGPLHIAAAVDRPLAAVFGGGTWPRFKPAARRSVVVVQPLPCFGCGWHCLFDYAPCVREIPREAVQRGILTALSSAADEQLELVVTDVVSPAGLRVIEGAVSARGSAARLKSGGSNVSRDNLVEVLRKLSSCEADRAARQRVIEEQGAENSRLQAQIDARVKEASDVWAKLNDAQNAQNLLRAEIEELRRHFEASEADRAARQQVIEEQGERAGRLDAERNVLAAQLQDLREQFEANEADRAARLGVIHQQGAEVVALQAEVHRLLQAEAQLTERLDELISARDSLERELAAAREHSHSQDARLLELDSELRQLCHLRDEQNRSLAALRAWQKAVDRHWSTRVLKRLNLSPN